MISEVSVTTPEQLAVLVETMSATLTLKEDIYYMLNQHVCVHISMYVYTYIHTTYIYIYIYDIIYYILYYIITYTHIGIIIHIINSSFIV